MSVKNNNLTGNVVSHCPIHKKVQLRYHPLALKSDPSIHIRGYFCSYCNRVYIDTPYCKFLRKKLPSGSMIYNFGYKNETQDASTVLDCPKFIFIKHDSKCNCRHDLIKIHRLRLNGLSLKVDANYCPNCHKLFMTQENYNQFFSKTNLQKSYRIKDNTLIIPHNINEKDLRFLRVYDEEFNKSRKWILINKIKSDTKSIIGIQIRLDLINQCIYVDKVNRKSVETLIWPSITSLRTYLKINDKIFIDRNELGKIVNYSKDIIKVSLSGKVMDFSIHEAFLSRYLKLETKKENQKFLDYLRHSANHRATSYNLIENAYIIDHAQCPNCSAQLTYQSHFMNSNGQLFGLDMFYCSHCEKYYILKDHYADNQKIYNSCCKCIEIKDPLQNNSEEQMAFIEYFYDKQVNHARFGFGRLVKCKNNSVYVSFHGNTYVFGFPDCFEKRDLVFTNKKVQTHMMNYIAFCEKDRKIPKINPISNKLTIQHTSYIDVRRITGLIYKIQLIGSSNNHVTRHHPIKDVVVKLAYKAPKSKTFDIISLTMHYCSQCKKYFDIKQSFLQQIQKAHLDIHNFAVSFESESGLPLEFKQMNLREFSKLKLFGYCVGSNGLSTSSRHDLIDFLLDKHLMTASEIKSHLQFNIRYIGNKSNMENAVGDWKNDIDYVNDYIRNGKIH